MTSDRLVASATRDDREVVTRGVAWAAPERWPTAIRPIGGFRSLTFPPQQPRWSACTDFISRREQFEAFPPLARARDRVGRPNFGQRQKEAAEPVVGSLRARRWPAHLLGRASAKPSQDFLAVELIPIVTP